MIEQDEWIFYKNIDWNDPKFNLYSIDTRDFHMGYRFEKKRHKNFTTLSNSKNKDKFFHTESELIQMIDRLYELSGGDNGDDHRCIIFNNINESKNWSFKYIRIYRTEHGFLVCNDDNKAFKKDVLLNAEIDKKLL